MNHSRGFHSRDFKYLFWEGVTNFSVHIFLWPRSVNIDFNFISTINFSAEETSLCLMVADTEGFKDDAIAICRDGA